MTRPVILSEAREAGRPRSVILSAAREAGGVEGPSRGKPAGRNLQRHSACTACFAAWML